MSVAGSPGWRERLEVVLERLREGLGESYEGGEFERGELTVRVDVDGLLECLHVLRDDPECGFTLLMDMCAVDYPERLRRFELVYHLLSMRRNLRIRVKAGVVEDVPAPSVSGIYPCADWYEREAYDMYGVVFSGHGDMRRLLTDYGFEGHPLRKDFPLTGFVEVRYDDERRRVVNEPVMLQQEYRTFDFESPWVGMDEPDRGVIDDGEEG